MNGFHKFIENEEITDKEAEDIASMPCKDVRGYFVDKKGGDAIKASIMRRDTTKKYAWTFPCKEYIEMIKKHMIPSEPLYDLMAGTGFVAKILRKHGINVKTYDKDITNNEYGHKPTFDPDIEERDAADVSKEFKNPVNILLSWIPYDDPIGEVIVKNLPVGSMLFLVGEGSGGATGTDALWDILKEKFEKIDNLYIPQWHFIHDRIQTFQKIIA